MREEQAKIYLKQTGDPSFPTPDFVPRLRELINSAGALTEIQIQDVIDEIAPERTSVADNYIEMFCGPEVIVKHPYDGRPFNIITNEYIKDEQTEYPEIGT